MNPIYGKYKFESQEPISVDGEVSSFTFVQNITCSGAVQITVVVELAGQSNKVDNTH